MVPLLLAVTAFAPMLLEAVRSRRNERHLRARGAFEPAGDVFAAMQIAYPAGFAALIAEAVMRRRTVDVVFAVGAVVFAAGKLIKYWAVASLGPRWTFRVLVVPATPLIRSGPYAYVRHPNYVGVLGELLGTALMAGARWTGPIVLLVFAVLLAARIRVEERALRIGSSAAPL
jgi:methyltransferase